MATDSANDYYDNLTTSYTDSAERLLNVALDLRHAFRTDPTGKFHTIIDSLPNADLATAIGIAFMTYEIDIKNLRGEHPNAQ